MPFCGKCGNEVPDGSRFCMACGAKVPEKPPVPPVANNEPGIIPAVEMTKVTPEQVAVPSPAPAPVHSPEQLQTLGAYVMPPADNDTKSSVLLFAPDKKNNVPLIVAAIGAVALICLISIASVKIIKGISSNIKANETATGTALTQMLDIAEYNREMTGE